jgi:hypothetical protein
MRLCDTLQDSADACNIPHKAQIREHHQRQTQVNEWAFRHVKAPFVTRGEATQPLEP